MKRFFPRLALMSLILLISSCGSPRTTIRVSNKADGTDTKISVQQGEGGSTSVNVSPSVNASIDSVTFQIKPTN